MSAVSWISDKTAKGLPSKIHGKGWFAKKPIAAGELLAIKGGHIIDRLELAANQKVINHSELQITDDLYLAPLSLEELDESMIYINHSCMPNTWFDGAVMVTASRDIKVGEELTIDYGAHFANPEFKMDCDCGSADCRQTITGNDWKIPYLQQKYQGHFAWFIQRKIDRLLQQTSA